MTPRRSLALATAVAVAVGLFALITRGSDQPAKATTAPAHHSPRNAAVRVATRFLVGMDATTLLHSDARRRFVARWASDRAEPALQRLYDGEASRMAPLQHGYSRVALVGYRVDRLDRAASDVTLWGVSLASVGDLPAAVGWRTLSVHLELENGAWRVASVREIPGPSPESRPPALRRDAKRFKEFRLAP